MSDARVAALVCEGQTDVPILRAMIEQAWPGIEIRCLQPELDETDRARAPAGWTQVKAWCEAHAGRLDELLQPDVGDPIDLLLVAIDMDIAVAAGIADPPRTLGAYASGRLRSTMEGWLKTDTRKSLPRTLIVSTPVVAIEAWIIAALFPQEKATERIADPSEWLVQKKKLRRGHDKKPWKELYRYRAFADVVKNKLPRVRNVCNEADRMLDAVEQLRDTVEHMR